MRLALDRAYLAAKQLQANALGSFSNCRQMNFQFALLRLALSQKISPAAHCVRTYRHTTRFFKLPRGSDPEGRAQRLDVVFVFLEEANWL